MRDPAYQEALDLIERVESDAESMLVALRDRMTDDEVQHFAWRLCGLTAELHLDEEETHV